VSERGAAHQITLRPEGPADDASVLAVYASTREAELASLAWTDEQKSDFLRMQFAAQRRHYREHYRNTSWDLILLDGHPVGRLYVARGSKELRIVDIALLPAYRRKGIGTRLLREICAEAEATHRTATIHVEIHNPARRLYERLGFRPVQDRGIHVLMERRPGVRERDAHATPQPNTAW
jgi:ribosomal protein S18 acetylase RimI-like enzyme